MGESPEASGMAFVVVEGGAKITGDSAIVVTLCCVSCGAKVSKGTRRSGCDAVPKMSPGSRSRWPVRRIVCRLEATKCSKGPWPSWKVAISTMSWPVSAGDPSSRTRFTGTSCGSVVRDMPGPSYTR